MEMSAYAEEHNAFQLELLKTGPNIALVVRRIGVSDEAFAP